MRSTEKGKIPKRLLTCMQGPEDQACSREQVSRSRHRDHVHSQAARDELKATRLQGSGLPDGTERVFMISRHSLDDFCFTPFHSLSLSLILPFTFSC